MHRSSNRPVFLTLPLSGSIHESEYTGTETPAHQFFHPSGLMNQAATKIGYRGRVGCAHRMPLSRRTEKPNRPTVRPFWSNRPVPFHPSIHPFIQSSIHPSIHPIVQSSNRPVPFHPSIHSSIHPFIQSSNRPVPFPMACIEPVRSKKYQQII